jgi:hypothetical protein
VKRILSAAAVMALGLSLFTACGDDDGGGSAAGDRGDYCQDLTSADKSLDTLVGGDLGNLSQTVDQIHKLRDEAPDKIEDQWKVLSDGLDKILAAFEKAGLSEEDIEKLQSGQMPDDVDMAELQATVSEVADLGGEAFTKAGDAIAEHAKDECGVTLGG